MPQLPKQLRHFYAKKFEWAWDFSRPRRVFPNESAFKETEVRAVTDETFRRYVEQYADTVFRVAFHSLRHRADAEDVMQTVFLRLYQTRTPFQGEEHVRHWLIRVAVNESRRTLRSHWRRNRVPLEQEPAVEVETAGELALYQAVMALPEKYRLCIYLYYYEGYAVKEIARALGAKESTVQTWLMRAREKLRGELTPLEEGM